MKLLRVGNEITWSKECTCEHCKAEILVTEDKVWSAYEFVQLEEKENRDSLWNKVLDFIYTLPPCSKLVYGMKFSCPKCKGLNFINEHPYHLKGVIPTNMPDDI